MVQELQGKDCIGGFAQSMRRFNMWPIMVSVHLHRRAIFVLSLALLLLNVFPHHLQASDLTGNETRLQIKPTERNYYLATLIQESDYYAPTYYDDYLLTLDGKPVVHMTRVSAGLVDDFYYYLDAPSDLDKAITLLEKQKTKVNQFSKHILPNLKQYRETKPTYQALDLHKKVAAIIREKAHTTLDRVVGNSSRQDAIDAALFRYLHSNGVSHLDELSEREDLIPKLVNKFYMLSTTYFYRDWAYIKAMKPFLSPLAERARQNNRPFKAKVFACSTGQEVFTYAVELLESGIEDFRILASDINISSLNYAEHMRYSNISVERLPLKTQERLRKYFKHNTILNSWEPKDPEFFRKRIHFVHQDLLKDLPDSLEPEFAPPYDLVSILNVLLYLEDSMVQSRKDYWRDLLLPGSLLILRDAKYSISKGHLGQEWSFLNFFSINEWVNYTISGDISRNEITQFYENRFEQPTELNLRLLQRAYSITNKPEKLFKVSRNYLLENPQSFFALNPVIAHHSLEGNHESVQDFMLQLAFAHIDQIQTLNMISTISGSQGERRFVNALTEKYRDFLINHRAEPDRVSKLFHFNKPRSRRWNVLRELLILHTNNLLLKVYAGKGKDLELKQLASESIALSRKLHQEYPAYANIGKFVNRLTEQMVEYYIEEEQYEMALQFIQENVPFLNEILQKNDYHCDSALGSLYLQQAILLSRKNDTENALGSIHKAIQHFQFALSYVTDLPPVHTYSFLGDIGHSYLIRGALHQQAGNLDATYKDLREAHRFFESALEINPLYGKEIFANREKLIKAIHSNDVFSDILTEDIESVPVY